MRFAKGVAVVFVLLQQREQLTIRIAAGKLVDVAIANVLLEQIEALLERSVDDVGGVGIPAQAHIIVRGGFHDRGGDGRDLGLAAMHLHPDLDAFATPEIAQLAKRGADVADGRFLGNLFRQTVRAHFDAPCAGIVREVNPLLTDVDLFAALGGVRGLKFASGAKAQQADFAARKTSFDALPSGGVKGDFDTVVVAGPQFDRLEASGFQILDDGIEVPIFQDIVGNGAKLHGDIVSK